MPQGRITMHRRLRLRRRRRPHSPHVPSPPCRPNRHRGRYRRPLSLLAT